MRSLAIKLTKTAIITAIIDRYKILFLSIVDFDTTFSGSKVELRDTESGMRFSDDLFIAIFEIFRRRKI